MVPLASWWAWTLSKLLASHVDGMARELAMETARPSETPELKAETIENDVSELLSTCKHCMYGTTVGIAAYCSDWRPDVQHAVNKICRKVAAPTRLDLRRLMRGPTTAEPNVVCWVDSDWAERRGDKMKC